MIIYTIIICIISSKYRNKIPLDSKALHFSTKGLDFLLRAAAQSTHIKYNHHRFYETASLTICLKRTFLPGQTPTRKGT